MRDSSYRNYLLIVLLVIQGFYLADRWAFGLVLQDIKVDLSLSDTQLGFLSGIAFAFFYSVMGIPIARWADRGNRVTIISVTIALLSAAVFLCGVARNFVQLALIRIGAAVGEAGCIPPAHSLIADHFTRAQRPRAVARYMLGGPLSVLIGYLLAGWLNEVYGWRVTFMLLGLPGAALAVLVWFTLREPRRWKLTSEHARTERTSLRSGSPLLSQHERSLVAEPSIRDVCFTLWSNPTFRQLLFGFTLIYLFGAALSAWEPAFMMRSYGLKTGALGNWFALLYGVGGALGTYAGGEWASRYAAGDERLQLRAISVLYAGLGVILACEYLSQNRYCAFVLIGLGALTANLVIGSVFATNLTLVPNRMRAMSIALMYLFGNLIGMGLGPLITGALSDVLRPLLGEESLRYASLALCPGYLWGAYHYWRASRTVTRDLLAHQKQNSTLNGAPDLESSVDASRA